MPPNTDEYLTAQQAADHFRVTLKTIYQWAKGGLASERHRGMHYFRKAAILSFHPPRGHYQKGGQ